MYIAITPIETSHFAAAPADRPRILQVGRPVIGQLFGGHRALRRQRIGSIGKPPRGQCPALLDHQVIVIRSVAAVGVEDKHPSHGL